MLGAVSAFAQNVQIRGTVSDETGAPLPGATILIKGTTTGTTTDIDGQYSISSPSNGVLVFSFIGYNPIEREVGNQSEINISLQPDLSDLDEVIVVDMVLQRKVNLLERFLLLVVKKSKNYQLLMLDKRFKDVLLV